MDQPAPENEYQKQHAALLAQSFERCLGRPLLDERLTPEQMADVLFHAPFALVSHATQEDPVFNYGNQTALQLFEMDWHDFTQLPSRLSAEPQIQSERDRLLEQVTQQGYIDDYQGVRISATGKRFKVNEAIVWNLLDDAGCYQGQAAVLYQWSTME